jgi:hypothetical protein
MATKKKTKKPASKSTAVKKSKKKVVKKPDPSRRSYQNAAIKGDPDYGM